jgi:glyoxylase-like metal-dependent hydrolase (beta-lactamase superfamily II)
MSRSAASAADRHAWAEPGVENLGDGVYRIPLPLPRDPLRAVNVFALTDRDGVDLIDAGMALAEARDRLSAALREIGSDLGEIRNFFVTHAHRDHYTLAVELRRTERSAIALGEQEQANLRAYRDIAAGRERSFVAEMLRMGAVELLARLGALARNRPGTAEWEDPDRWLADGTDLALPSRTLRVIHTPGHTRGHVVFHDAAARVLFAGDHVLPHITPTLGYEPAANRMALRDYLSSLALILALPDARLLPAHGPVQDSTHSRVRAILAHHETRLTETCEAVRSGAATVYEVANAIVWTRARRSFTDLDLINQVLATGETSAHLEVLVTRGQLTRHSSGEGADLYSLGGGCGAA